MPSICSYIAGNQVPDSLISLANHLVRHIRCQPPAPLNKGRCRRQKRAFLLDFSCTGSVRSFSTTTTTTTRFSCCSPSQYEQANCDHATATNAQDRVGYFVESREDGLIADAVAKPTPQRGDSDSTRRNRSTKIYPIAVVPGAFFEPPRRSSSWGSKSVKSVTRTG